MSNNSNQPPPWSEAPPWAKYIGQQPEGDWYAFSHKPTEIQRGFTFGYRDDRKSAFVKFGKPNPNWRDTMQKRPENE